MLRFLIRLFLLSGTVIVVAISFQCGPPLEFKPQHDSLIEPPLPPRILKPFPDTTFYICGLFAVEFDWKVIDDAESYEIQICSDSLFTTEPTTFNREQPPINIYQYRSGRNFYRLRAKSSHWTFYTDWSGTRFFDIVYVL